MRLKIPVLPSNQASSQFSGMPAVTEQRWAVEVCKPLVARLIERGADARMIFVPGAGSKTTDELEVMIDQAVAWHPDYMLSVHADWVGDKAQTGILMLMARPEDRSKGERLGRAIATNVGLPYKEVRTPSLMFTAALQKHGLQGSLVEVGEYGTAAEAKWDWEHTQQIGLGIADALADYLGLAAPEEGEDMSQEQVEKLIRSAQAASFVNAITNALLIGDKAAAAKLNQDFYERFPSANSGLPKGWQPPK